MKESDGSSIGVKIIHKIDSAVNFTVLTLFLCVFAYGCYGIRDTNRIYQKAEASSYEIYKPSNEESLSFEELQSINPEVFAWLTVYGTHIDYPLLQADNNEKYVSTDAKGEYSLSGSLFLDYRNSSDFTDFNNIIYGHHMEKNAMFGEIEKFSDKSYFDSRRYGNLYVDGKNYGLEFFAFLCVDAYDHAIYTPAVGGQEPQQRYLEQLNEKAMYQRDIGVTTADRIVLLSTCTSDITNGRQILAGRLTDEVYEDTFGTEESVNRGDKTGLETYSVWRKLLVVLILVILLLLITVVCYRRAKKKRRNKTQQ